MELINAVSYVIYDKDRTKVLAVKRPPEDEIPNVWGLPAATVKEGEESFEDAVVRSGKQKLGVTLQITDFLNEGETERSSYVLHMRLYEVKITNGEPKVPQPFGGTQYVEWKWADPEELKEAASKGSLCSRLFLNKIGIGL